jgi:DeoR family glycerol-3-phosphate regulon repressor
LAHALAGHSGLRAFTNDLEVARIIAPACENLVVVGGRIETEEMATFGSEALAQVAQNHVDVSVISAGGLSTRALLTDFSDDGMRLRTQMSRCGQTRYVIVDHEKFGVVGQFSLAIPNDGLCLVFDRAPPDDLHQVLDAQGFRYIVADTDQKDLPKIAN